MRIGVLSDLHWEPEARRRRRWINPYEPEALEHRLDEALRLFEEASVDLVLLLGDLTELGDVRALRQVLARCSRRATVPVAAVSGNHDHVAVGGDFVGELERHRILAPAEHPLAIGGATVGGITPSPIGAGTGLFTAPPPRHAPGQVQVLASHYPLISMADVLAGAGLRYPRDLVNRAELEATVSREGVPTVVLSGHIHARCAAASGPILQLTVGSLIEPPFDCTLIELKGGSRPLVRRSAHRLGPVAAIDPVFVADTEHWRWNGCPDAPAWSPEVCHHRELSDPPLPQPLDP